MMVLQCMCVRVYACVCNASELFGLSRLKTERMKIFYEWLLGKKLYKFSQLKVLFNIIHFRNNSLKLPILMCYFYTNSLLILLDTSFLQQTLI